MQTKEKIKDNTITVSGVMRMTDIKIKSEAIEKMVNETKITSDSELNLVANKIKEIKDLGKVIKAEKEKFTKPAQSIINEARSKYLPYEKICSEAEVALKAKADMYMGDQERERLRKEESIARRAEKGQLREETAIRKLEEIGEEKKSIDTGEAQLQRKTVKSVVIVDREKIPHEYWVVDEVKVRKVALAGVEIPGVTVKEKSQMVIKQ